MSGKPDLIALNAASMYDLTGLVAVVTGAPFRQESAATDTDASPT